MWTAPLHKTSWGNLGAPNVPGHCPCQQMTEQCPAHRATTSVVSDPNPGSLASSKDGKTWLPSLWTSLRSPRRFGSKRFPPSVHLQIWLAWPSRFCLCHSWVQKHDNSSRWKRKRNKHGVFQAVNCHHRRLRDTWAFFMYLEQGMVGYTPNKNCWNDTLFYTVTILSNDEFDQFTNLSGTKINKSYVSGWIPTTVLKLI